MSAEAGSWSVCSLIWTQHLISADHQTGMLLCTVPFLSQICAVSTSFQVFNTVYRAFNIPSSKHGSQFATSYYWEGSPIGNTAYVQILQHYAVDSSISLQKSEGKGYFFLYKRIFSRRPHWGGAGSCRRILLVLSDFKLQETDNVHESAVP